MAATPVLDLQPGDQIAHKGGWFTLAARPAPHAVGGQLTLTFVGGSHRSVHWLAHLTTRKEGS
ncbi:hypothetical protein O3Q52_41665 [Streptomyces sp. ActVer]|uniref:hypothetical protein n=1 Tax=Streptomyces sp. ActVer TaxID=3014558 RepID=UPI0022B3349E|nr:hypothetical protein [Streptomyces sp. ActVer]MCZ4514532.1 hypothetical protein [Streptomyces sp. ActVer]